MNPQNVQKLKRLRAMAKDPAAEADRRMQRIIDTEPPYRGIPFPSMANAQLRADLARTDELEQQVRSEIRNGYAGLRGKVNAEEMAAAGYSPEEINGMVRGGGL